VSEIANAPTVRPTALGVTVAAAVEEEVLSVEVTASEPLGTPADKSVLGSIVPTPRPESNAFCGLVRICCLLARVMLLAVANALPDALPASRRPPADESTG